MVANDAMELARMCARAADDAKAENVRVYDLRGMSSLTDFMVVCTGLSVPHLRAVIRELEESVREKTGALPTYVEDTPVALWSVVDYIDVMVHIMGQETREILRYGHPVEGCPLGGVLTPGDLNFPPCLCLTAARLFYLSGGEGRLVGRPSEQRNR